MNNQVIKLKWLMNSAERRIVWESSSSIPWSKANNYWLDYTYSTLELRIIRVFFPFP